MFEISTPAVLRQLAAVVIVIATAAGFEKVAAETESGFRVPFDYQTSKKDAESFGLSIKDANGEDHVLYDESNAILIFEEKYVNFADASGQGEKNLRALTDELERLNFRVTVWKDLKRDDLWNVIIDAFSKYGYGDKATNGRLFFYYYGHGDIRSDDRGFIVPVDAPRAEADDFESRAIPMSQLVEQARAIQVKHAFFAFEACHAGSLILKLGDDPKPATQLPEYLIGVSGKPVRQFLSAGDDKEEVPAGEFTSVLVSVMKAGAYGGGHYVTGNELGPFVKRAVPEMPSNKHPEFGTLLGGDGDFVFGPSEPGALPLEIADLPTPALASGAEARKPVKDQPSRTTAAKPPEKADGAALDKGPGQQTALGSQPDQPAPKPPPEKNQVPVKGGTVPGVPGPAAMVAPKPQPTQRTTLCGESVAYSLDEAGTAESYRPFVGVWVGEWLRGGTVDTPGRSISPTPYCGALIVEKVDANGIAEVYYVDVSEGGVPPQTKTSGPPLTAAKRSVKSRAQIDPGGPDGRNTLINGAADRAQLSFQGGGELDDRFVFSVKSAEELDACDEWAATAGAACYMSTFKKQRR